MQNHKKYTNIRRPPRKGYSDINVFIMFRYYLSSRNGIYEYIYLYMICICVYVCTAMNVSGTIY